MPLQVPLVVVRVEPTVVVPEITGGAELIGASSAGGASATVAVWAEGAAADPAVHLPVRRTTHHRATPDWLEIMQPRVRERRSALLHLRWRICYRHLDLP